MKNNMFMPESELTFAKVCITKQIAEATTISKATCLQKKYGLQGF